MSDGLDSPLPCDVEIGPISFKKGVALRVFVTAARRWYETALEGQPRPTADQIEFLRTLGETDDEECR